MVTNTPIDKESFRLTQAAQKVQELLDLIQSLSEDGYTNDLQSLVDVVEDWNDSDTGASFTVQLQNIFADFLSKQEILPKILATGETYQTEVNGENVSLGSDMPVQSSTIYESLAQYGIRQLPGGGSWSHVDGMPGCYSVLYGSQSNPSEDGLYLYAAPDSSSYQNRVLYAIYLTDKNGETFGGIIGGDGVPSNTVAIIQITHDDGARVIFRAQKPGNYLSQQLVEELPEQSITSDFSSSSDTQFTSDNRSAVSRTTQDDYSCQAITATGNSSSSYYAMASFDFSDITDDAQYLTVEFDSKIPSMRWYISLVNSQYRPGTSAASSYDDTGVAFKQGIGTTSNYIINDSTTSNTDMYNNWVHTKLIVDLYTKKVDYTITQMETGSELSGTASFLDNDFHTNTLDHIEVYTWVTGNDIYIANMSITAFDDTTNETTRYLIQQDDGNTVEYIFYDGKFVCTGRGGGSITVDDIADGTITSEKLDFNAFESYLNPSELPIGPNSCTESGQYIYHAASSTSTAGNGFPEKDGVVWSTGTLYVGSNGLFLTQLFVATGKPEMALRTGRKSGAEFVFSDWQEPSGGVPYSDTPSETGVDLNTLTETGIYAIQNSGHSQWHCPTIDGEHYWESGVVIVGRYAEGCTQMFLNWAVDDHPNSSTLYPSAIAIRTLTKNDSGGFEVSSDWNIIGGETQNWTVKDRNNNLNDVDLNTLTDPGVYSVTGNNTTMHFPNLGTDTSMEGALLVAQNLDGCNQMYMNYAIDSAESESFTPFIAFRTLNYNSGSWTVDSDWKIIDLSVTNEAHLHELSLNDYIERGTGAYTIFGLFPEQKLDTLFVLKNDVPDYTSTKILINDEVGYALDTTIKPNTSYLATVTKQPQTGADHSDGSMHIYGAFCNSNDSTVQIVSDDITDGAVTPEKATFTQYSETPLQIGTWIDGTPVWRLAFESEVAADTTDEILITFAASDNNVRVLLCKVWLTMVSEGYGVSNIDSYEVDPNGEKTYYSTNSSAGKLSIIKGTATPENRVYGYIDFVTPESNILSS